MSRRPLLLGLLSLAALILPACGDSSGKDFRFAVHPAGGKVLSKGKPVPKAVVRFHPTDPATVKIPDGKEGAPLVLTTLTEADGTFAHSTYLANDGVPAGDYKVTVVTGLPATDLENSDTGSGSAPRPVSAAEKKYRDPATTPLKATVKPGENHFVLELE